VSKDRYLFKAVFCLTGEDGADRGDFVFSAGRFSIEDNTPEGIYFNALKKSKVLNQWCLQLLIGKCHFLDFTYYFD